MLYESGAIKDLPHYRTVPYAQCVVASTIAVVSHSASKVWQLVHCMDVYTKSIQCTKTSPFLMSDVVENSSMICRSRIRYVTPSSNFFRRVVYEWRIRRHRQNNDNSPS